MKDNRIMDCDVFCIEDFQFDGEIAITGNFYSCANINVRGIKAVENIYLESHGAPKPPRVTADFICSGSSIFVDNVDLAFDEISSCGKISINFNGPIYLR